MAQRTQVLLIDDLDGSSAEETVAFGLDGAAYEIDLSAKNANELRESLATYVAHGRKSALVRVGGRRGAGAARASSNGASGLDTSDVRTWARANGYSINDRGRLASDVLDAYRAAH